jgi:hypothetical protein
MMRLVGSVSLLIVSMAVAAEPIDVPNASFESPAVVRDEQNPFGALPWIDDWDETAIGPEDEMHQDTGVFLNTDPLDITHIFNPDLDRLAFISSLTGNDLRQELTAVFTAGRHYRLTVGMCKSLYLPVGDDEKFEVALFYVNNGVEHVVASEVITGVEVGSNLLVDVSAVTHTVKATDAGAGWPISVLLRPALDDPDNTAGEGMWDADHVRVEWFPPLTGDLDDDGDVDEEDVTIFNACVSGPSVKITTSECAKADLDDDDDADQSDFGLLQANLHRPG